MHKRAERPWPCPKCGSHNTVRDEKDGYLRRCLVCGCRKAFEAFSGPPLFAGK